MRFTSGLEKDIDSYPSAGICSPVSQAVYAENLGNSEC